MSDEELQHKIEQGFTGDSLDEKAYRRVFDALKKEPVYQLPSTFANQVIHNMRVIQQPSEARAMFWLYAGLTCFLIAAGISIYLTEFKIDFGVLKFISGSGGLIIFGILFILVLHLVDKRFVRKTQFN